MTFQQDIVKVLFSADGEPVALHDFGGSGPALLLGHGNGLNAGMWAAALPMLLEYFHCYGVDLRGHGAARDVSDDYSVARERFAEDLLTCVDTIGGPVRYGGHSLGAAAALYATLIRPEAFTGMWLYEPVVIPIGFDPQQQAGPSLLVEAARHRRMEFASVDEAVDRFSSKPPFFGCDSYAVRGYVEIGSYPVEGGIRLSCRGENEAGVYETGGELDFGRLRAITVPTVVASGGTADEANSIPPRLAPQVADALANTRWEQHRWVSHFGPMEAPRSIAKSIITHLG